MPNFTYTLGIPAADHNPSVDQPDMQINNDSIASIIDVDHYGFNDGSNFSGYHDVIRLPPKLADPAAITGIGQIYTKTISGDQQLYYESGNGVVGLLSNPSGISVQAAVNFTGVNVPLGSAIVNNSYNVASVIRGVTGFYTITFTNPLPTANYYVDGMASGAVVQLGANISAPTATSLRIQCFSISSGSTIAIDPPFVSIKVSL